VSGWRQRILSPWVAAAVLVFLATAFTFFNRGERVSLHVGFTILYRISLVGLVFTAFILGMITMFLFSLRHDLRVRRELRERRYGTTPPEYPQSPFAAPPERRAPLDPYGTEGGPASPEPSPAPPAREASAPARPDTLAWPPRRSEDAPGEQGADPAPPAPPEERPRSGQSDAPADFYHPDPPHERPP
jgi:hypothetical protein